MTDLLRAAQARALLAEQGVNVRVGAVGHEGEIAAISAPPGELAAIARHAAAIRALGFRYVALDIGPAVAESASS